jgi:hypothetical protein
MDQAEEEHSSEKSSSASKVIILDISNPTIKPDTVGFLGDGIEPKLERDLRFFDGSFIVGLCDLCSVMTIDQLRSKGGFKHYKYLRLLRAESESQTGCRLCRVLWKRLAIQMEEARLHQPHSPFQLGEPYLATDDDPVRVFLSTQWRNDDLCTKWDLQVISVPDKDFDRLSWRNGKYTILNQVVFSLAGMY